MSHDQEFDKLKYVGLPFLVTLAVFCIIGLIWCICRRPGPRKVAKNTVGGLLDAAETIMIYDFLVGLNSEI
ncbi:MAG: hypothetical protein MHMPM18_001620 [Marteilia pararefringens]